jgi:hypothetical protein
LKRYDGTRQHQMLLQRRGLVRAAFSIAFLQRSRSKACFASTLAKRNLPVITGDDPGCW